MKSFSFKALALALVVVAGSAQAYTGESLVKATGELYYQTGMNISAKVGSYVPENVDLAFQWCWAQPYEYHKTTKLVLALGVVAAAYKTYKHFTKPAADATVEGENVDANVEATTQVA